MERQLAVSKPYLFAGVLVFLGLYLASLYNYLLFHSLAEIFSIVVAFGIFTIAWNSRRFLDNNYLLFIGIAYLFVGGLDLIHTLAYKGMDIFKGYQTNLATQLWIAARYTEGLSLLIAPLFFRRRFKINFLFFGYTLALLLVLISIFYWNIFPICYVEGIGLTPFKKISEYIISLILLASIVLLLRNRSEFDWDVFKWLVWSIILTIASELSFTSYIDAYGFSNLVGHFLKILSFYLIYKAIIETGLTRPYDLLFRNLKQSEVLVREEKNKIQNYLDIVEVILVVIDAEQKVSLINKKGCETLGYDEKEILGKKWLDTFVPEKNRDEVRMDFEKLMNGEIEPIEYFEKPVLTRTGEERMIAWHNAVLRDKKGNITNTLSSGEDITERKKMEEELRRSRDELETKVQERTAELMSVVEALQDEMADRKQAEEALRKLNYELNERIKEINCLYSISYYVGKEYALLEEKLHNIVNLIPSGWQYPEITCARIVLEGKEYKSDNFKETPWKQTSDIIIQNAKIGTVEVCYLEEKPVIFEGPFLKEERSLINLIAIELGEMIGHMQAEKAVEVERQRFNDVLEMLPAYLVLLTPDYHVPFANRFFRERFGESRGQRCFEYLFGRSEPCEVCETYTVLKTMAPHKWEWTGPDGRNYDVFDFPFTDTDGSTLILEMGIDITERKRAEETLKATSQYARSLIEASLDPLVTISADGKVMDVNKATELVTGVPRDHLVGSDFSDYFTEPKKARDGYQQVFEMGSVRDYSLAIRHKSGNITEVLYNATVYRNEAGEVQGVFAAARDITAQKLAEEKAMSEHALRASIENSIVTGILVVDKRGQITHLNPAFCRMTGWNEEELIGTVPPFSFWPSEDLGIRTESFRALLRGQMPSTSFEARLRRKNEERFDALVVVSCLRNAQGKVLGWVASVGDISQRKEIERRTYATNVLLNLFSKKSIRREYLDAVVDLLQSWSGCQCVGVRVLDKQSFIPYESYVGFSQEFWKSENWLSVKRDQCACIRVVTGNLDPQDATVMTPGGSFYCDNTFKFIGQLSEQEKARFRGVCVENGFLSVSIVPIRYREEVLGAIHLADEREGQVALKAMEFIESMSPLIGEALNRFNLEEEIRESENRLRNLSSQLLTIQEKERKRVAHELHDGLGQMLTAIKFKVENTLQQKGKVKAREKSFEAIIPMIRESVEEVRRIQMDLRPSILDDLGILATISWFSREFEKIYSAIRIEKEIDIHEDEVPAPLKTVIYRVTQEALNNIAKHSAADLVHISLRKTSDKTELVIQDNGTGFDLERTLSLDTSERGFGLSGMKERVELSGGSFVIESIEGEGTIIKATWPI